MGKTDPEVPASGRKRQLNLIYFIDASRTRTINLPLFQVNVLLFGFIAVMAWAVGSIFVLFTIHRDNEELAKRLRTSMATLFDYEVRHDGVYEIAYPGDKREAPDADVKPVARLQPKPLATKLTDVKAPEVRDSKDSKVATQKTPSPVDEPMGDSATLPTIPTEAATAAKLASLDAKPLPVKTPPAPIMAKPTAVPGPSVAVGEEGSGMSLAAKTKPDADPDAKALAAPASAKGKSDAAVTASPSQAPNTIVVGNPVIESAPNALQLRFDLTNKSNDRAEGYIWAVAAFKTDKGELSYIADPPGLVISPTGEPESPLKTSNFGIRHFKKISFSFPVKGQAGTFTGIRIGVTDKKGQNRSTYNVPVEIRVGKTDAASSDPKKSATAAPAPTSL